MHAQSGHSMGGLSRPAHQFPAEANSSLLKGKMLSGECEKIHYGSALGLPPHLHENLGCLVSS